ncbi:MAG TPA: histidine kinase [Puia sp.]|nr:histidine kinase [Puia sp.]
MILKLLFYIPILLLAVWFNLYVLIPRYLEKGRFRDYIFALTGTLFGASLCIVSGYYITAFLARSTVSKLYGPGLCSYYFFGNAMPAVFAGLTFSLCVKMTRVWIQTQRRQQLLEKEQLETELNFLKQQFNPHFLFNTINSIFFLIHKKPDTASGSLARFSDLLRYQLYECNVPRIVLSKEINYLKNCIELEKLRQNDNVRVSLELDDYPGDELCIAPFMLMTFVENAFKHVSKEPGLPNWITIRLKVDRHRLNFFVSNSRSSGTPDTVFHNSGIGLKNVRRRLDLLYPGRHELKIQSDAVSFEVHLGLDLSPIPQDENFDYLATEINSRLRAYERKGPYMAPDGPQTFG